jgi:MoaD family protein
MKVNFFSTFREQVGTKTLEVPLPVGDTVHDLIFEILRRKPTLERYWLDETGHLFGHVHISLNQVDVMALPDGLDTQLKPDDVIDFFPPITGG